MLSPLSKLLIKAQVSYSEPRFAVMPGVYDEPDIEDDVMTAFSSRVILFNDEWHTFEEVIEQIIKATGCNFKKAEKLTLEVHNAGKAMVFDGDFVDCLRVSSVLEEIKLRTQIEC
jgi:ATP-dependent Clp protease adaptor protein ClpS